MYFTKKLSTALKIDDLITPFLLFNTDVSTLFCYSGSPASLKDTKKMNIKHLLMSILPTTGPTCHEFHATAMLRANY